MASIYLLHLDLLEPAGGAAGWERILSSVCVSQVGKVAAYPPTKQVPTARRRWSAVHTPPPTLPYRPGGFLACFACALPGPGFASGYLDSSPPASPAQGPERSLGPLSPAALLIGLGQVSWRARWLARYAHHIHRRAHRRCTRPSLLLLGVFLSLIPSHALPHLRPFSPSLLLFLISFLSPSSSLQRLNHPQPLVSSRNC